ncbi:MAG TPA: DNA adenine methylase [Aggregatilinea sp.]|uniref:DNA adenine methylase n=1 Tax=Aggregatilinea sp. TaxID=2806333 RepID=UPI002D077B3D|nr:DNA adenine methylase [Aggregatilinea sp.]HML24721.1 DNA adenine methylase [Aggregatilinea sp.]
MTDTSQPTLADAQPFLKWAGGKGQLLAQYDRFFPTDRGRAYFEPFAGSGAVFFELRKRDLFDDYALSDVNPELINCYLVVRNQVDALVEALRAHKLAHEQDDHQHYYEVRDQDRDPAWAGASEVKRAARMIYLNKTCYNGLWRVNSKGQFNVPMGRYKNPDVLSEKRLRAASLALQNVDVNTRPFTDVLDHAQAGDFVYFDPPYDPLSSTANFTSYSADSFGQDDQRRLAETFRALSDRGCKVMLSNSDTPFVRGLYEGFTVHTVTARRAINSKGGKRGEITEVLVVNY